MNLCGGSACGCVGKEGQESRWVKSGGKGGPGRATEGRDFEGEHGGGNPWINEAVCVCVCMLLLWWCLFAVSVERTLVVSPVELRGSHAKGITLL